MDFYNIFKLTMVISFVLFAYVDYLALKVLAKTIKHELNDFRRFTN